MIEDLKNYYKIFKIEKKKKKKNIEDKGLYLSN